MVDENWRREARDARSYLSEARACIAQIQQQKLSGIEAEELALEAQRNVEDAVISIRRMLIGMEGEGDANGR